MQPHLPEQLVPLRRGMSNCGFKFPFGFAGLLVHPPGFPRTGVLPPPTDAHTANQDSWERLKVNVKQGEDGKNNGVRDAKQVLGLGLNCF